MRDGQRVTHVATLAQGKILVMHEGSAHVSWPDGSVTLESALDLLSGTITAALDGLEDSLEVGSSLMMTGARAVFDDGGATALVTQMSESGHLAAFEPYVEDALAAVTASLRNDPGFRQITAQLDDDEAEATLRVATLTLIRDAFAED